MTKYLKQKNQNHSKFEGGDAGICEKKLSEIFWWKFKKFRNGKIEKFQKYIQWKNLMENLCEKWRKIIEIKIDNPVKFMLEN